MQLTRGSLAKLAKRQREEFLPLIRPTLEEPNAVLKQADGALIFVKDFGGVKFFASVARGDSGEWVITSNAPKTLNNLKNKIKEGGEVLISDSPGLPIIASPALPAKALNGRANQPNPTTQELKSQGEDLLDPSKPLRRAKPEEITEEFLEEVKKRNTKVWVGDFAPQDKELNNKLDFDPKYPIKITFNGDALKHIDARHGEGAILVKKGQQPAVTREDIVSYGDIVNNADKHVLDTDKHHQKVLISGKQINGYVVVVETISTKKNELKLKTLYKENGKLENNPIFKEGGLSSRLPEGSEDSLSPKPSVNLDAPQQTTKSQDTIAPLKSQGNTNSQAQGLYY
ncbi:PBECR3 domain-containing polyvalent protein [Helicobacter baculiformis]|uniref:PBECR3 domain-containing polyvalent protein n=1 Tax=Helicobacter baculiformis TaxID=427351 RepID=UPI0022785E05|nr:PBECR2 nuclease fold domain-containing protein [Helicobacter baculiformis]